MLNQLLIDFLETIFNVGNTIFALIPIMVWRTNASKFYLLFPNKRQQNCRLSCWIAFFTASHLLTLQRLLQCIDYEQEKLLVSLFYILLLVAKFAGLLLAVMYQTKQHEFCQFYNQFLFHQMEVKFSHIKCSRRGSMFDLVTIVSYYSVLSLYALFVPMIFYNFPELMHVAVAIKPKLEFANDTASLSPTTTTSKRIFGILFEFIMFMPVGVVAGTSVVLAFSGLQEIIKYLRRLRHTIKLTCRSDNRYLIKVATAHYKRNQILTVLCNSCFQAYLWPVTMFCGASLIIPSLFCLLAFGKGLPMLLKLGFATFAVLLTILSCIVLNLCSEPIIISLKVLRILTRMSSRKYDKKVFQSLMPIFLKVGEFHKMDKCRVVSYLRFILQRTVFLVLKSKTSDQL